MLDALLGIMSSGGLGAVVGLAGSLATKWLEYKTMDQKLNFEVKMADLRKQELEMEHKHALAVIDKEIDVARTEGEIARDVAEMEAFTESQRQAQVKYGGIVDKIRGLMRPLITVYLMIITTIITSSVWERLGGLTALPADTVMNLFEYLVHSAVFLTITAVTWWFGTRPSEWRKPKST